MAYSYHRPAYDLTLFEEPYVDGTSARVRKRKVEVERTAVETPDEQPNKPRSSEQDKKDKRSARLRRPRIKRERRRKHNFGLIALGVIFGVAIVVTVAAIIHSQVQLTELNQEIIDARADLAEKQSVYTQLEMKVDSSISTSVVEEYAQQNLEMSKASNSQKEYISLSDGDKAEVTLSSHESIFELLADAISSLWS